MGVFIVAVRQILVIMFPRVFFLMPLIQKTCLLLGLAKFATKVSPRTSNTSFVYWNPCSPGLLTQRK